MNERMEKLAKIAFGSSIDTDPVLFHEVETFAELIINECMYAGRLAQINNQLVDAEIKDHFGSEELPKKDMMKGLWKV